VWRLGNKPKTVWRVRYVNILINRAKAFFPPWKSGYFSRAR
jgi:hypothetical protein